MTRQPRVVGVGLTTPAGPFYFISAKEQANVWSRALREWKTKSSGSDTLLGMAGAVERSSSAGVEVVAAQHHATAVSATTRVFTQAQARL